jgi:phage terminase large subunit-like protein
VVNVELPTLARFEHLPRLRPRPWPITPYGPFRQLPDGRLEKFETDGEKVIRWIEKNCIFSRDRWLGRPFRLLPWQKQLLLDLFELVYDPELGRLRRRFRTAMIGIPKKQGKTELVAALADYFLLGAGEPDPKIAVVAAAETQADYVFGAASTMIEHESSPLRGRAQCFARVIQVPGESGSWIKRIPANGGKFDGAGLGVGLADELHEWLTHNQRKMHGMISGALATREEPLHVCITTAGEDVGDEVDDDEVPPWLLLYRVGRRIETGELDDPTFFFRWWMAPVGANHRSPETWADPGCNPSYNHTVKEIFYLGELNKRTESEMRRYYLNQPQDVINNWLEEGAWEACYLPGATLLDGVDTWLAWDASTKSDSTVVVAGQFQDVYGPTFDGEPLPRRIVIKAWFWERPIGSDGLPILSWRVPMSDVKATIANLAERYPIVTLAYDPMFIAWVADDLRARGLPVSEIPQSDARMAPATQATYEAIIDGTLAHDGTPAMARHIKAARATAVSRGAVRLTKDRWGKGRKIDFAIALVMLIGEMRAVAPAAEPWHGIWIPEEDDE